ncbi:MAG: deoxyribonuclease IV [Sphaerochaetaceae bacterium]|jgi:deoxyribonuclease-4|nr:deoxyribonuclease IV [Sphaerochaetaceae bacterium]NLO60891.1 deoxyribonuclease IV [Spirochaetales bacterium]MDD2404955.1 deoxyribonuclease IV [Sphaerochaetaceae bacterium]MDD3671335.1 deoxyribonuclease IV [Sphaerochaetaceae bacterium]MDD4258306.1 deoxyribonuclease IV [Sphaerochaetaceae bacterium]
MYYIGAHVSAAGGAHMAVENARAIGANAFALFTKNQKQWKASPLTTEDIALFSKAMKDAGFSAGQVLPHDGYLINMGNPDPQKRRISVDSFIGEMQRVRQLGLDRLNFHPGAHLNQIDPVTSMHLISEGIDEALDQIEGVYAVIETTAGQGSALGRSFEEIATIIEGCAHKDRIGVCIDTCHIFAAGYEISTEENFQKVMQQFDSILGFDVLMGMHLNDAKSNYSSNVDRHAPLGDGTLGLAPFKVMMNDKRFENIPLILETTDPNRWEDEIRLLRSFTHH